MTPLEELRSDGHLGPAGARLLYRIVRAVVVGHGFPPPRDRRRWTAEAVAETAHEFLADGRTPKRLAHLLVHAVDDDSFDRLLHRMVLNFLRDGGRRTEIGRLMLRLRDVLGCHDEFVAEALALSSLRFLSHLLGFGRAMLDWDWTGWRRCREAFGIPGGPLHPGGALV